MNILSSKVNTDLLEKIVEVLMNDISFNGYARLMTSNRTIKEITGSYFYDDRRQEYMGIPFIRNDDLDYGEVVILTQKM